MFSFLNPVRFHARESSSHARPHVSSTCTRHTRSKAIGLSLHSVQGRTLIESHRSSRPSSPTTPRATSNTKILLQIVPPQRSDRASSSAEQSVAWSVNPNVGWIWWPFSFLGRRFPRHGGHLHDGKSGEHTCSLHFSRISLAGRSGSLASDGKCKHSTVPRARCTRNISPRVAQECCVTQRVSRLK